MGKFIKRMKHFKSLRTESSSIEDKTPAGNRFLIESNKATAVQDTEGLLKFLEEPEYQQMSLFG